MDHRKPTVRVMRAGTLRTASKRIREAIAAIEDARAEADPPDPAQDFTARTIVAGLSEWTETLGTLIDAVGGDELGSDERGPSPDPRAEIRRERSRKWMANRRAERRAAGLCVRCGGPVAMVEPEKRGRGRPRTGATCDECLAKSR